MKQIRFQHILYRNLLLLFLLSLLTVSYAQTEPAHPEKEQQELIAQDNDQYPQTTDEEDVTEHHPKEDHSHPSPYMVIPFVVLLLMIAAGPVFFEHFWHKNYKWVAPALGLVTLIYYLAFLEDFHHPAHALSEYISFIALLGPLYVASSGILIQIDREGKPLANLAMLLFGALIANVIGTTGASMLLIRPFIKLNRDRLQPYHIIFFIFIVSNVGGALTPIGDPPLFLGFLRGVPFEWTILNIIPHWGFALALLAGVFLFYDYRNKTDLDQIETVYSGKVVLRGTKNFIWLGIIVGAVFLDPNLPGMEWLPRITDGHGNKFSFVREAVQFSAGAASYFLANKSALRANDFTFEPIMEVVFLFLGIFFAMMPALQLIGEFATTNGDLITEHTLYWATGSLSAFLDNAPTYINFLSAACAKEGLDVGSFSDVATFAATEQLYLSAISVAAVFFGAMSYIGNGPNFMVKAIAEERGIQMPSFFAYMIKYSLVILLPILILTWLVFFVI